MISEVAKGKAPKIASPNRRGIAVRSGKLMLHNLAVIYRERERFKKEVSPIIPEPAPTFKKENFFHWISPERQSNYNQIEITNILENIKI